eukprot:2999623-Amphidinium_carterae.1
MSFCSKRNVSALLCSLFSTSPWGLPTGYQDVFTFNIKTTSGKYMVISETVDRSGMSSQTCHACTHTTEAKHQI